MTDLEQGPSGNGEEAPTMVYELWSWHPELGWLFVRYDTLSLYQVLNYMSFGYLVERSRSCDRNGTLPLFPRLEATYPDWGEGLD